MKVFTWAYKGTDLLEMAFEEGGFEKFDSVEDAILDAKLHHEEDLTLVPSGGDLDQVEIYEIQIKKVGDL